MLSTTKKHSVFNPHFLFQAKMYYLCGSSVGKKPEQLSIATFSSSQSSFCLHKDCCIDITHVLGVANYELNRIDVINKMCMDVLHISEYYWLDPNEGAVEDAFRAYCNFDEGFKTCLDPLQPTVSREMTPPKKPH